MVCEKRLNFSNRASLKGCMRARLKLVELPLSRPAYCRAYHRALERVLANGKLILGSEVTALEEEFAKFCGARECVTVANGTEALQVALRLSGVEPGAAQEVITTPLTASFTAHAIVAAGAKPMFADVDAHTLLINPEAVAASVNARTAALLPVHLYGQACDLGALRKIADGRDGRNIALVQDAAQAHGTRYRKKPLAQFTDIACFSFYPTKNLGALGDGGALVTNSPEIARQARLFRDGGRARSHSAEVEGINSRLDELQAAFLRIHLKELNAWNQRRAQLEEIYDDAFRQKRLEEVQPIARAEKSISFRHLYVIRVQAGRHVASPATRNELRSSLMEFLAAEGIDTGIHYEHPLHLQPAFRRFGYARGDFPKAELACDEILSLPMHPFLSREKVHRVVNAIAKFFKK
jgi:dTDP-4-amino-4,6-dideoxygalactose transaminase